MFDNSTGATTGKWCCGPTTANVDVEFAAPYALTHFTVTSANDVPNRDPVGWAIQGSNDGLNWTNIFPAPGTIDVSTNFWTARYQTIRFDLPAPSPFYTMFRYQVYSTSGTEHQIAEIELFGDIDQTDSDTDGMPDWYENRYAFLNANDDSDAGNNNDGDTLSNLQEYEFGSAPDVTDTDGDGLDDGAELAAMTDPNSSDTDGDGFSDKLEVDLGSLPNDGTSLPSLNPVFWGAPADITGKVSDLDLGGTLVAAYAGDTIPATVGGIEFVPGLSLGQEAFGFDPLDRFNDLGYEELMDGASYSAGSALMELTGLTPGTHYQIQIWVADTRGGGTANRERIFTTDPGGLNATETAYLACGTSGDPANSGQHVIGTFTAAAETQYIYVAGSGAYGAQYNAVMLRQIDELPDRELKITTTSYEGGIVTLMVTGFNPSRAYQLLRSENLQGFNPVGDAFTPAAAIEMVQDIAPIGSRAFYRIEEVRP